MKLLIATPLYPPDIGGPATYSKILEDELPKCGIEVTLVKFGDVRHLPKGLSHITYFFTLFRAARTADMVLALDPASVGLPAALAAMMCRKKFVVKIVGDYAWEQGAQRFGVTQNLDEFVRTPNTRFVFGVVFLRWMQKFVAQRAERVIVPSKYLKDIVAAWGITPEKIDVIFNAFEGVGDTSDKGTCRKEYGLSGTVILSAGRLVPWKGFGTIISLLPQLQKTHSDLRLYIAGSGPLEGELKRQITQAGLEKSVTLLGNVPRALLAKYISAADCFVLNTSYEGLSHQLLEVMAIGTPIVTTNVGGNPELIENEKTGFLVPYDNSAELSSAIERVFRGEGEALANEAKQFVSSFTVSRMVDDTIKLLRST